MRIGIIGGGQLAAMLVQACTRSNEIEGSDHQILTLDKSPSCPAAQVGGIHVQGVPATGEGYNRLSDASDIITIDLENVSVKVLAELESRGQKIIPAPSVLAQLTNKLKQKQWLTEMGIPTAAFMPYDGSMEIDSEPYGFPVVQKAATGGYDGRGVAVLHSRADNETRLRTSGYIEQYINRKMEVSVMVAASEQGEVVAYQPVEMVFREDGNVLDYLVAPARLPAELLVQARELAVSTIRALQASGIFGIEMFLTESNELLVNEISPRTHNSGHFTTEACLTSQFSQQLRILTGMSLGDVFQFTPAAMFNLLGARDYQGEAIVEQDQSLDDDERVAIHLYGKRQCFAGRKMGHVTVTGDSVETALQKMKLIRRKILVRGAEKSV